MNYTDYFNQFKRDNRFLKLDKEQIFYAGWAAKTKEIEDNKKNQPSIEELSWMQTEEDKQIEKELAPLIEGLRKRKIRDKILSKYLRPDPNVEAP